jgi:hypothetical protein
MSSWATSAPRTFMNDANRNRFSNAPPPFENDKFSVGPCAYSPKIPRAPTALTMKIMNTCDGVSERAKEVYGTPVTKILPISATTYTPRASKESRFDNIVETGLRPQHSFTSVTQRQLWPKTDITAHPEEYPPGPSQYELPELSLTRTRSPTVVVDTREERHSNSPVQKDPLPTMYDSRNGSRIWSTNPSPVGASRSPSASVNRSPLNGTRGSSNTPMFATEWSAARSVPRGPTISTSPRHFNIHNLNSRFRRELDPDFDNPPPGAYDAPAVGLSPRSPLKKQSSARKF